MMKWVLIIVFLSYDGNAITTHEFNYEEACKKAEMLVEANEVRYGSIQAYCIQDSDKP